MNPVPWLAWLALAAWTGAMAATGQVVYKCSDDQGRSHYQDVPCPAALRPEWVRETGPAPSPTPQARATPSPKVDPAQRRLTAPRRARAPGSVRGVVISQYRDAVACERARKAREQAYARLGLRRDFATSRRLDDRVHAACR